jgi:hypothetical protein
MTTYEGGGCCTGVFWCIAPTLSMSQLPLAVAGGLLGHVVLKGRRPGLCAEERRGEDLGKARQRKAVLHQQVV